MRKIFMIMGALLLSLTANAQVTLKIETPEGLSVVIERKKSQASQPIKDTIRLGMDNEDFKAASFACRLYMPEGISIDKNNRGKLNMSFNEESKRTDASMHTISSFDNQDGSYDIGCYTSNEEIFQGESGAILDIPITVAPSVAYGNYELMITNQKITNAKGTREVFPADYKIILQVVVSDTSLDCITDKTTCNTRYNLAGLRVDETTKGIIIENGKKIQRK